MTLSECLASAVADEKSLLLQTPSKLAAKSSAIPLRESLTVISPRFRLDMHRGSPESVAWLSVTYSHGMAGVYPLSREGQYHNCDMKGFSAGNPARQTCVSMENPVRQRPLVVFLDTRILAYTLFFLQRSLILLFGLL
jgi:hypothetical protein